MPGFMKPLKISGRFLQSLPAFPRLIFRHSLCGPFLRSVNRLQPRDPVQRSRKSFAMQRIVAENSPLSNFMQPGPGNKTILYIELDVSKHHVRRVVRCFSTILWILINLALQCSDI